MIGETSSDAAAAAVMPMPGFRFHPTDEELLRYFLNRKVRGKSFPFEAIPVIDIYKHEPSDLAGLSQLKSRDLEWYFFSALDKKYRSGSRTNRTTERGYWKTTGKDRPTQRNGRTIGMKKTLVYHIGRAPHGERTDWVMHEYRLEDNELVEAGVLQDAYVVCRVFRKSGPGPKNGEQYGAPFIEEEWGDVVPQEQSDNEAGEHGYIQLIDLDQNPEMSVINGNAAPVTSFNGPDNFNNPMDPVGFFNGAHQCDNIDKDYIEENDIANPEKVDQPDGEIEDQPTANANNQSPINDGSFLEWNDLDDFLMYFDATDNKWHCDDFTLDQPNLAVEADEGTVEAYQACQWASNAPDMGGASSSGQKIVGKDGSSVETESTNEAIASDVKNEGGWNKSLTKRLTSLLDSIPSPPAFAAEYPLNEGVKSIKQNSASTSGSVHVNAEAFFISKLIVTDSTKQWSVEKGDVGFHLSYGIRRDGDVMMGSEHLVGNSFGLGPLVEISRKATSVLRCGFYLCFIWVLILAATFKIGNYFFAK